MAIDVFISYSPADAEACRTLETHLSALQRSRLIRTWTAHQIGPGHEWRAAIEQHLSRAQLILLLISPDFLASNRSYDVEMSRALELNRAGSARVVPIIVRHVDWKGTLIDGLVMLPDEGRPVSSAGWQSIDKAWTNVALGLRRVVEEMMGGAPSYSPPSGRSFVESRGSYASTPPPQSAPTFVAPSSRAPHTRTRPSAPLHNTGALTEVAIPISAYRTSHRAGAWSGSSTMTRPPKARRASLVPLIAALVFAVAGVAAAAWMITQPTMELAATPNLKSAGMVTPSPSPTLPRAVDPAPITPPPPAVVAGPCCGGIACDPGLRDTRGSMCDTLPDHCAICPSLRTNVEGACRDPLDPSQRFLLRLARLDLKGMDASVTRVCVRLGNDPVSASTCTSAADASDAHPGVLGVERNTRLWVSVADLVETGRGLDIDVEIAGRPTISSRGLILKGQHLLRSALCQGVSYAFNGAHVSLFLDDR